ncbi:MAG: tetratricopeptide repeat protein [Acidobacteriota bacterium]
MTMSEAQRGSPYLGLIPYDEQDAPFFFGREKETRIITANLFASRLTLLYGASGVGKSSVLRAGVVHQLRPRKDVLAVVFSDWQNDPLTKLKTAVAKASSDATDKSDPLPDSSSLAEYLAGYSARLNGRLMIILDQFEEYFLYHAQQDSQGTFDVEFPRAVNRPGLRVNFLISIRQDALAELDRRFKGRITNLFNNRLEVKHLSREAAKAAIEKPIDEYNSRYVTEGEEFSIEPDLVNEVLIELQEDGASQAPHKQVDFRSGKREALIVTPYLQLLMARIWEKEIENNSRVLRLKTLKGLEGLRNIVQVYLNNAMDALSPREREIAADMFDYLVTPSGTKIAYMASDLAIKTKSGPEQLKPVMDKLSTDFRILRSVDPPLDRPNELRYEVYHDVLAVAVLIWQEEYRRNQVDAEAKKKAKEQQRQAEEKARAEEQAKANAILRRWLWALAFMTLLAMSASVIAYKQSRNARASEQKALDAQKNAEEKRESALQVLRFYDDVIPVSDGLLYGGNQRVTLDRLERSLQEHKDKGNLSGEGITLAKIGDFYHLLNKDTAAQEYYERALPILENVLGKDHLYVATILDKLATVYLNQGNSLNYSKAEPLEERALMILKQALGAENVDVATARNNLGLIYLNWGKYAEAEPLFNEAIDIDLRIHGKNDVEVANGRNNLALLYLKQGRYAEAQSQFEQALDIWKKNLGEENTTVADGLTNLAEVYRKQGQYIEAEPRARRAFEIWEKQASAPDDPDLAQSLNILGMIYSDEGRFSEAGPRLKRALAIREKALGLEHEKLAISLNALAVLSYRQGKNAEAEQFFKRALKIRESALGPDHPDVAETLRDYATLLRSSGREAEAAVMDARAEAIRTRHAEENRRN